MITLKTVEILYNRHTLTAADEKTVRDYAAAYNVSLQEAFDECHCNGDIDIWEDYETHDTDVDYISEITAKDDE